MPELLKSMVGRWQGRVARKAFTSLLASILLMAALPSQAKVSTSAWLCFEPNQAAISPALGAELTRLVGRSKGLGDIAGIFVLSIASPGLESQGFSKSRATKILAHLAQQGFSAEAVDVRRIEASAVDMGCRSEQVAVEIEAVFPHDGYR